MANTRKPVCVQCGMEMKCKQNGYEVHYKNIAREYCFTRSGDKFMCLSCGYEVVANFGKPYKVAGIDSILKESYMVELK